MYSILRFQCVIECIVYCAAMFKEVIMINLKKSKTKRIFAAVIIVILVLAMVLPMAVSAFI